MAIGRHFRVQGYKVSMTSVKAGNALLDGEIVGAGYTLFKKAWLGSEKGSEVVDCMVETRTLRE